MFIEKVLIFILFLGPLVFFHELGHFLFARLFGVRVEVFSIGFGPKLFKFKKGDTEYAFSLIPLGGYVKMFGDDPLSEKELSEDEKKVAFTEKSKWAKFWIVFGGPLANFILAYFLYFSLLMSGEKVPQARFGNVPADSNYYSAGLRTGDVLKKVNATEILSFDDLNLIDSEIKNITVERDGKDQTYAISLKHLEFLKGFSGLRSELRAPVVTDNEGNKWIISLTNDKFDIRKSIETMQQLKPSIVYLLAVSNKEEIKKLEDYRVDYTKVKELPIEKDLLTALNTASLHTVDLVVRKVVSGSPAEKAKLVPGDIITHINNESLFGFEDLRAKVQKAKENEAITVSVLRKGEKTDLSLTPQFREVDGKKVLTIGVWSGAEFIPIRMIESPSKGILYSFSKALSRTTEGMVKTFQGYKKLITNEVPLSNIGGPLAIGKVASDSFNISLSMFFRLMAIISINLGIINLFPIPVLDGGHIVFLILEVINRGPLSRKKMQMAQQFGMSLLFILIFVALFNDITRIL
jgi:regulator of sigma E protease